LSYSEVGHDGFPALMHVQREGIKTRGNDRRHPIRAKGRSESANRKLERSAVQRGVTGTANREPEAGRTSIKRLGDLDKEKHIPFINLI